MIRLRNWILLSFFCLSTINVFAIPKEGGDTLRTRMGDKVIVLYEYNIMGNKLTIRFKPAIKRLGDDNARKYRKLGDLTVVFFDRKGSFEDATFTGDVTPEAFVVPSNLSYELSREGYYLLHDSPSISFSFRGDAADAELSFPAYLAYHYRKGKYRLIARCGSINIKAIRPKTNDATTEQERNEKTRVSIVEVESDNSDMTRILDCIANINARLSQEDRLPMSESLEGDVRLLREWKYSVTDAHLKEMVNETLDAYEQKKRQLENDAVTAAQAEQKRVEEELKAQNEAEAVRQNEAAEKNRKRNIWMVIGGVILAVGAFVGNQFLQIYKNKKSQKDMLEMQQSMVKKAENESKKQAQSKVRSQVTLTANNARGKTHESIKKNAAKIVEKNKNKKSFSI